jgi:hypothetical protein
VNSGDRLAKCERQLDGLTLGESLSQYSLPQCLPRNVLVTGRFLVVVLVSFCPNCCRNCDRLLQRQFGRPYTPPPASLIQIS